MFQRKITPYYTKLQKSQNRKKNSTKTTHHIRRQKGLDDRKNFPRRQNQ